MKSEIEIRHSRESGNPGSKRSLKAVFKTWTPAFAGVTLILMCGFIVSCAKQSSNEPTQGVHLAKYHCPMHPNYVSDKPGDCPICGMRLVPIEAGDESTPSTERKIIFYRNPMNPKMTSPVPMKDEMGMDYVPVYNDELEKSSTAVAGQATVRVSPERQQLIGVQVAPVEQRELTSAIRASARVAYDPDLYNAIYEHQQVLATQPSSSLRRASELRLRQMGLSEEQIRDISKPGFDPSNLLLSQKGGRVWVYIDLYDFEAPQVKSGQKADLTSPSIPGKIYPATVRSVDAVVNSETRTLRARADVVNSDGALRPEMYLNAVIHVPVGHALAVPESAVMDTGVRQLVYVEKAPGEYEPRPVSLGKKAEGYFEVLSGVKEGERVVTSANFLIDSESKLKGAVQGK